MKVGILDYGVGNLASVARAVEQIAAKPILIERAIDIHQIDALILPGVGSFTDCKKILDRGGWTDAIKEEVFVFHKPLLGICLGMQLLADFGEEGSVNNTLTEGMGLIPGKIVSLKSLGCVERIPHVGWNSIDILQCNTLFNGVPAMTDFYFVHSYAFVPADEGDVLARVDIGVNVTAAIAREHVWGTQFHPEKSSKAGIQILKNFIQRSSC